MIKDRLKRSSTSFSSPIAIFKSSYPTIVNNFSGLPIQEHSTQRSSITHLSDYSPANYKHSFRVITSNPLCGCLHQICFLQIKDNIPPRACPREGRFNTDCRDAFYQVRRCFLQAHFSND